MAEVEEFSCGPSSDKIKKETLDMSFPMFDMSVDEVPDKNTFSVDSMSENINVDCKDVTQLSTFQTQKNKMFEKTNDNIRTNNLSDILQKPLNMATNGTQEMSATDSTSQVPYLYANVYLRIDKKKKPVGEYIEARLEMTNLDSIKGGLTQLIAESTNISMEEIDISEILYYQRCKAPISIINTTDVIHVFAKCDGSEEKAKLAVTWKQQPKGESGSHIGSHIHIVEELSNTVMKTTRIVDPDMSVIHSAYPIPFLDANVYLKINKKNKPVGKFVESRLDMTNLDSIKCGLIRLISENTDVSVSEIDISEILYYQRCKAPTPIVNTTDVIHVFAKCDGLEEKAKLAVTWKQGPNRETLLQNHVVQMSSSVVNMNNTASKSTLNKFKSVANSTYSMNVTDCKAVIPKQIAADVMEQTSVTPVHALTGSVRSHISNALSKTITEKRTSSASLQDNYLMTDDHTPTRDKKVHKKQPVLSFSKMSCFHSVNYRKILPKLEMSEQERGVESDMQINAIATTIKAEVYLSINRKSKRSQLKGPCFPTQLDIYDLDTVNEGLKGLISKEKCVPKSNVDISEIIYYPPWKKGTPISRNIDVINMYATQKDAGTTAALSVIWKTRPTLFSTEQDEEASIKDMQIGNVHGAKHINSIVPSSPVVSSSWNPIVKLKYLEDSSTYGEECSPKLTVTLASDEIIQNLQSMWMEKRLCDVTLVCEADVEIKAHRVILASHSANFVDNNIFEACSGMYNFKNISPETMTLALEYLYGKTVNLDKNTLALYTLACQLDIKPLISYTGSLLLTESNKKQRKSEEAILFLDSDCNTKQYSAENSDVTNVLQSATKCSKGNQDDEIEVEVSGADEGNDMDIGSLDSKSHNKPHIPDKYGNKDRTTTMNQSDFISDQTTRKAKVKSSKSLIGKISKALDEKKKRHSFVCDPCNKPFTLKLHLDEHMDEVHAEGPRIFRLFGKSFKKYEEHHSEGHKEYKCLHCGWFDRTWINLFRHHCKKRKCGICHKRFRKQMLYDAHKCVTTKKGPVGRPALDTFRMKLCFTENQKCSKCDEQFIIKGDMQKHVAHKHDLCMLYCEKMECNEIFMTSDSAECLEKHLAGVHQDPWLQCPMCDFQTTLWLQVNLHMSREHKRLQCLLCDHGVYDGQITLMRILPHLKAKHQITIESRLFQCPEYGCTYTSYLRESLTNHMTSHTEERPFKCDQCSMTFKLKR